jgi:hypothetical protein
LTATAEPPKTVDGSPWIFPLDSEQPNVLDVKWTQTDGTKRLDEVKFRNK